MINLFTDGVRRQSFIRLNAMGRLSWLLRKQGFVKRRSDLLEDSPHCNQEQIRHKRRHRRNTQYILRRKNHGDIPKKTRQNKLETNNIIANSF
jgi:hypothetical protein